MGLARGARAMSQGAQGQVIRTEVTDDLQIRAYFAARTIDGHTCESAPLSPMEMRDVARRAAMVGFELAAWERIAHRLVEAGMPHDAVAKMLRDAASSVVDEVYDDPLAWTR